MNLDDLDKLKFDRRLEQRHGWVQPGEREAFLETLQDVSGKIHDGTEEEPPAAPAAAPEAPASDAPPAPAGGLGGSTL